VRINISLAVYAVLLHIEARHIGARLGKELCPSSRAVRCVCVCARWMCVCACVGFAVCRVCCDEMLRAHDR